METPKIEIKEMPTKEVLEAYLAQIALGTPTTVIFNTDEGRFEVKRVVAETPILWP